MKIKIFLACVLVIGCLGARGALAVQRVFKVVLVRTAETGGNNPSTVTMHKVMQEV